MVEFNYSLDIEKYTIKNAFLWGNCKEHFRKALVSKWEGRIVHALIGAVELIPIIGQIASIAEYAIIKAFSEKPIVKTFKPPGGFANGGNTCYIAAALQALRMIPAVRTQLHKELSQAKKETNEEFTLRMKIQKELVDFYAKTDAGETIEGKRMSDFHQLLHTFSPSNISPQGKGGDSLYVVSSIKRILKIKNIIQVPFSTSRKDPSYSDNTIPSRLKFFNSTGEPEAIVFQRFRTEIDTPTPLSSELPIEFEYKTHNYTLVAASNNRNWVHSMAYLRNSDGRWVWCNDGRVSLIDDIKNEQIQYLYYTKN